MFCRSFLPFLLEMLFFIQGVSIWVDVSFFVCVGVVAVLVGSLVLLLVLDLMQARRRKAM
jgi:hypothetical protein